METPPATPYEPVPPQIPVPPAKKGLPVWAIVLIVLVVILCVLPLCVIGILALLGPAIGNIFSNVMLSL